jgi:ubiquinone/menaquinone biosynthesis C-methylase UbiE
MIERVHGRYVHQRRVEVLARHVTEVLPLGASVLDVGCGDGRLARQVMQARPDISITGVDVLVRPETEIPVRQFNGTTLPFDSQSVDVVMFVDVLHHTDEPMVLLREATRVARTAVLIKDHTEKGPFAHATLRFMDQVGNRRHGVALPHNYWKQSQWDKAWRELQLTPAVCKTRLGLYPFPANLVFERGLHFVALLRTPSESDLAADEATSL